ncbi:MAG: gliding motility-associated C-terminal domain-containing protein [Luteibaculaceae bacterium]
MHCSLAYFWGMDLVKVCLCCILLQLVVVCAVEAQCVTTGSTTINTFPFQSEFETTCTSPFAYTDLCSTPIESFRDRIYRFSAFEGDFMRIEVGVQNLELTRVSVVAFCPDTGEELCVARARGTQNITLNTFLPQNTEYLLVVSAVCNSYSLTVTLESNYLPTTSDCLGAIEICNPFIAVNEMPQDDGVIHNEIRNLATESGLGLNIANCGLREEGKSIWFSLNIRENGFLRFVLTPTIAGEDFDFIVYDGTEWDCAAASLNFAALACNSFGLEGHSGVTGISSALGGTGSSNGPGTNFGGPFNADLFLESGSRIFLMVNKFSPGNAGFTIDFSASDEQLFFTGNPVPPKQFSFPKMVTVAGTNTLIPNFKTLQENLSPAEIDQLPADIILCNTQQLNLWFTEPLQCFYAGNNPFSARFTNLEPLFVSEINTGAIEIESWKTVDTCSIYQTGFRALSLSLVQPLNESVFFNPPLAPYSLSFSSTPDTLVNFCGVRFPHFQEIFTLEVAAEPCFFEGIDLFLSAPNVITPNNDGVNDFFVIQNLSSITSPVTLQIFNRWGRVVFESNQYQNNFAGERLPDGVYFYVITVPENETLNLRGSVHIFR